MANKEEIYDDQISPLMTKIIDICQSNNIAYICSFALNDEEEGDPLLCTSLNTKAETLAPEQFSICFGILDGIINLTTEDSQ